MQIFCACRMIDEDFNSGQIEIEKNNLFRNII